MLDTSAEASLEPPACSSSRSSAAHHRLSAAPLSGPAQLGTAPSDTEVPKATHHLQLLPAREVSDDGPSPDDTVPSSSEELARTDASSRRAPVARHPLTAAHTAPLGLSPTPGRSSIDESVVTAFGFPAAATRFFHGFVSPSRPSSSRSRPASRPAAHPALGFGEPPVASRHPTRVRLSGGFVRRRPKPRRAFMGFSTSKSAFRPTPEGASLALLGRCYRSFRCRDGSLQRPCQHPLHGRTASFVAPDRKRHSDGLRQIPTGPKHASDDSRTRPTASRAVDDRYP